METLLVPVGLIILAVPILVIYLLIAQANLLKRIKKLETQINYAQPGTRASQASASEAAPRLAPTQPTAVQQERTADPIPPVKPGPPSPKSVTMKTRTVNQLIAWLTKNWFYAVSAVSLALAGIFLVQYSIEKGLLPPLVRVLFAILLGTAFIGGGEYIRRRFGDDEDSSTAYLPSVFSSAGIVTLFGAVLSARSLYGLIGPEIALIGMALIGAGAMVLGWFYGPLLAAIGVIGAVAAPFIVGGSSPNPSWLFAYFAIIVVAGLAIDTIRRWAWVSVLSLALGFAAGVLIVLSSSNIVQIPFMIYCAALVIAAVIIPVRQIIPNHQASPAFLRDWRATPTAPWPDFPTRIAAAALVAACSFTVLLIVMGAGSDIYWSGFAIMSLLAIGLPIWARSAPALDDFTAAPTIALGLITALGGIIWADQVTAWRMPDGPFPVGASIVVASGVSISAVAAWRSLYGKSSPTFFALFAALCAPCLAILAEVVWQPANAFATYGWALHAMIIAIIMVVLAERFHAADGPRDRLRTSFAALSAIASVAFGLVILFSSAALTVSLAITIFAAAAMDRRFKLPAMSVYILVGIGTVMYRLVVDPGLDWAHIAPLPMMLLSHGGALAAFGGAWYLVKGSDRPKTQVMLDSAAFSATGILVSLLVYRAIVHWGGIVAVESHWSLGIAATIWLALAMTQLRRLKLGGALSKVRSILSVFFCFLGGSALVGAVLLANPLLYSDASPVLGPILLTTLIPAYLLPGVILSIGALWLTHLESALRLVMAAIAGALGALWLGLTIRHFWRGPEAMHLPGIEQGELYSYTVVLLLAGAIVFYQSLARRNAAIRKAGLIVIGLAVAKVFLIDISGLGGLTRVFSLLFLGLALAGLAWLNRWAEGQRGIPEDQNEMGSES